MSSKRALISPTSSHSDDDSMPLASRMRAKFQTKTEKNHELTSNKRKNPFERVFNKDDEIVVLRGIVDYKLKTGRNFTSSPDAFFKSIHASLSSSGITQKQVIGKCKRLKFNFFNYFKQGQNDRTVEDECYQLGLKIWGNDSKGGEVVKDEMIVSNKECVNKDDKIKDCWSLYPNVCESLEESEELKNVGRRKEYVQEVVSGIGADKAGELEEDWKGVRVMEAKVLAKQTKALMDVLARCKSKF